MDSILRSVSVYFILLIVLRLSGKRTLSEMGTFDFVLLLIIGEATQQALLGNDFSVTNSAIIIVTLIGIDILMSLIKQRFKGVEKIVDGTPLIILENGKPIKSIMEKERVDEADILEQARMYHGIERLEQIKYAVLERSGDITIIPKR